MYNYNRLDDVLFAMMIFVEKSDVSMLKQYKLSQLLNILRNREYGDSSIDTYDEYYEDIDEKLKETNRNFFEELYEDYDDRFTCNGILDDDDLSDYDELLNIIR